MGTQGAGRKRSTNKDRTTAEDDALNLIAREAEARLAAKRAARAEAREIRMKELERQQKELSDEDERMSVGSRGSVKVEDGSYLEKGSRAASALTATTLTTLGGSSSRRGSGETALTLDAETSLREIKDKLVEVEEKYRKAMVSNAQLDNDKNNLMYQVDTLKDSLMELEEQLSESRREHEDKVKDFEREKHAHTVLQFQFSELKETLKQSEELLNEIRQLRLKEEGFHREISDLQETVDWKDKKISALERQKEYTDAIRIERDELREEAVKLKDILKKHGIVLGPDLNINGSVTETANSEEPSADPASPSIQQMPISPTDGNSSMLGNTEEETNNLKEETDPERNQDVHDYKEKDYFKDNRNESNESEVEICGFEDQPISSIEHLNVISEAAGKDQVDTVTSFEKNVVEAEPIEQKCVHHQELEATQDFENIASQPTSQDHLEEQASIMKEVDVTQMIKMSAEQSDSAAQEGTFTKESMNDQPVAAAPKMEDLETLDGDSEGIVLKSQTTLVGGKKKKRKKRSKKKGDKNEQNGQEKPFAKQDSRTGEDESLVQDTDVPLTDHHSHNITDSAHMNLVDASKDDTGQMVEDAEPFSKTENDTETKSLMDNYEKVEVKDTALAEANATRVETSCETAVDSTHCKDLESTDMAMSKKRQSLDNGAQEFQSEVPSDPALALEGNAINVDPMNASDNTENVVALKSAEDGQPSFDIKTISEKDGSIVEIVQQNLDTCGIESEAFSTTNAVSQVGSSELSGQDDGIEKCFSERNDPELIGKDVNCETKVLDIEKICKSVILSKNECPNLQHLVSNEEPIANDAKMIQAVNTTVVEDMGNIAYEKTLIEEGKDVEIKAFTDDKELKLSQRAQDEASTVFDVSNECSNDKEVEEALASDKSELGTEVLMQENLSEDQSTDDIPQVSNQNSENGNKDLDVVATGMESAVQINSKSVAKELNDCDIENKEVGGASGEDPNEVRTTVLVKDNTLKDLSIKTEPQIISQSREDDLERAKPLVDIEVLVEDDSKHHTDNGAVHAQTQIDNDNIETNVESKSAGQSALQDFELCGPGMEEDEAKPLVNLEDNSKDQADNSEMHVQNQVENGHEKLDIAEVKSGGHSAFQDVVCSMDWEAKPLFEIGVKAFVEDSNSNKTHTQNQTEHGSNPVNILDTGSQNALEIVKDYTEVEAKPSEEKDEIEVEGSVVEDNLKEPSLDSDSQHLQSQNMQNLGGEPQHSAKNDTNIEACHVVELSGLSVEVEADQCDSVGPASEEEDDVGEGLSFDFDDLEMEAAIALSTEFRTAEEEVELGVEAFAEEGNLKDDLCDNKQVESQDVDNACGEVDTVDKVGESAAQNDDSESLESASLVETSQEQIGASSEHTQISNSETKQSSPKIHSKDSVSGKSREEASANSGAARSRKEAKRSSKKGKGKGKDECKMT